MADVTPATIGVKFGVGVESRESPSATAGEGTRVAGVADDGTGVAACESVGACEGADVGVGEGAGLGAGE